MKTVIKKHKRYLIFSIGGIIIFLFEILSTILFTELFNIHYMYSYGASLFIGMVFLFFYHMFITFNIPNDHFKRFFRFMIINSIYFIAALFFVYILTEIGLHYIMSITISSIILSIINYCVNKNWVFK